MSGIRKDQLCQLRSNRYGVGVLGCVLSHRKDMGCVTLGSPLVNLVITTSSNDPAAHIKSAWAQWQNRVVAFESASSLETKQ